MTLLLKTQQELHRNTTKWNKVIEKIKKINFKKYDSNQTVGFIIDDIVKGEFINEDNIHPNEIGQQYISELIIDEVSL